MEVDQTAIATPPSGGDVSTGTQLPEIGTPQETPQNPQGNGEPQSNGQPKVEGQGQPTSSQTPSARPPSASYWSDRRASRQKMGMMEQQIAALQKTIEQMTSQPAQGNAQAPKRDYKKEIWDKPVDVIEELIGDALNRTVPQILDQRISQQEQMQNRREALELIFANKRVAEDGDAGYERIVQIMKSRKLDVIAQTDPKLAAESALEWYEVKYPKVVSPPKQTNPLAPTNKGQMASVQTGTAPALPKKEGNTVNETRKQLQELRNKIIANPDLNYNPEIKKQVSDLKAKISTELQTAQNA